MADWKPLKRAAQVISGFKMRPLGCSNIPGYEIKERIVLNRKPTIIFTNGNILPLSDAKRGWEICRA